MSFTQAQMREAILKGMERGWGQSLDRLEDLIARATPMTAIGPRRKP